MPTITYHKINKEKRVKNIISEEVLFDLSHFLSTQYILKGKPEIVLEFKQPYKIHSYHVKFIENYPCIDDFLNRFLSYYNEDNNNRIIKIKFIKEDSIEEMYWQI